MYAVVDEGTAVPVFVKYLDAEQHRHGKMRMWIYSPITTLGRLRHEDYRFEVRSISKGENYINDQIYGN